MAPKPSGATINPQTGAIVLRKAAPKAQGSRGSGTPAQSSSGFIAVWTTAPLITEDFLENLRGPLLAGSVFETFKPSPGPLRSLWQLQHTISPGRAVSMPGSSGSLWRLLESIEGYTPSEKITQYNAVVRADGMPISLLTETRSYYDSRQLLPIAPIKPRPTDFGPAPSRFAAAWQNASYVDRPYLSLLQDTIPKDTYVETSLPPRPGKPSIRNLWIARQDMDPRRMSQGHVPLPWQSPMYWMHVESLHGPTPGEKLKAYYQRRKMLEQQRRQEAQTESRRMNEASIVRLQRTKSQDSLRQGTQPQGKSRLRAWKPFGEYKVPPSNPRRTQSIPDLSRYAGSKWSIPPM